jgi:hypothetical protein
MAKQVTISDELYARLEALSGGLFSVPEVIERLETNRVDPRVLPSTLALSEETSSSRPGTVELRPLSTRSPRERGATVKLNGHLIQAETVRDLYEQALKYLVDGSHIERLAAQIPFRTSNQRYLIAKKPEHQNGNKFVVAVSYHGYWMEAHKNYQTAIKQLGALVKKAGLPFQYLG